MNILHIDSSILGGNSITRTLSQRLTDRIAAAHPQATVRHRDLAVQPIPHLSGAYLGAKMAGDPDGAFADEIALGDDVMTEFLAADIIVIGAPMYNFSVSSQLKAWIDRVCVAGTTFAYSPEGPRGLAGGKKVFVLSGRGSAFVPGSPAATMDFQEPYLRAVMGFVGITDVTIIRAEGVGSGGEAREHAIGEAEAAIDALPIQALAAQATDDARAAA